MTALLMDEPQIQGEFTRSALHWGDGDDRIEAIRQRYLVAGTWTGEGHLTAKQRDILGVLRVADEPLSNKDLFLIFDGVPRTWAGYDSQGIGMALKQCLGKGLVERVPRVKRRKVDPNFGWRLTAEAVTAEVLLPKFAEDGRPRHLEGVGRVTGRVYHRRKRRKFQRPALECGFCGVRFRRLRPDTIFCSDRCAELHGNDELGELVERQRRDHDYVYHRWMPSLDAEMRLRRDPAGSAGNLYEFIPGDGLDPAEVVEAAESAEERRLLLGDMCAEDIYKLNDHTLEHLQDRLRELGMAPHSVQRKERQRLKTTVRHRGGGPPATFQPIHRKRRNRKQQVALMSGKRISRKQRRASRRELRELDAWS